MIEAVVFDMDGLLVDSEPLWQRARIEAFGAERLGWTPADQTRVMGAGTRDWAQFLAERLNHELTADEVIERVVSKMEAYYRESVPLLPGAERIVPLLAEHYPVGLASGAPYRLIRAVMQRTGWDRLLREVLSSDDLTRGKPAPDIYLEIARRMGVAPERILVFEDSGNGILAALAAGMPTIAVPNGYHRAADDILQRCALVLESLEEFTLDHIAGW